MYSKSMTAFLLLVVALLCLLMVPAFAGGEHPWDSDKGSGSNAGPGTPAAPPTGTSGGTGAVTMSARYDNSGSVRENLLLDARYSLLIRISTMASRWWFKILPTEPVQNTGQVR